MCILERIFMQKLPNNSTRLIGNLGETNMQCKFTDIRQKNKLECRQKKKTIKVVDLVTQWKIAIKMIQRSNCICKKSIQFCVC